MARRLLSLARFCQKSNIRTHQMAAYDEELQKREKENIVFALCVLM